MILFVPPVGVALAQRRPRPPAPYQHLSMWRLLGGELICGLQHLGRWARRLPLVLRDNTSATGNLQRPLEWNETPTKSAPRRRRKATTTGATVVAVDGSAESRAALQWAADHTRATGTHLKIVTAYPQPVTEVEFPPVYVDLDGDAARTRALEVIVSVLGHDDVDHVVAEGSIDTVLVEHADGAATIVIGTRARRRFWHRFRPSLTNRITGRVDSTVISVPYVEPIRVG